MAKGKDFSGGKGKTKGFGGEVGKGPSTAAGSSAQGSAEDLLGAATQAKATDETEEKTRSRPSSTSSRKSTQQTPHKATDDDLAMARKLMTMIEQYEGDSLSLVDLRKGIIEHTPAKPAATLCGENHERATAVAKALRHTELTASALTEAQAQIDNLKDKYDSDKSELRSKYEQFKDELGVKFDSDINEARLKRNGIAIELDKAEKELDKAQKETMSFYNAVFHLRKFLENSHPL